MSNRIDFSHNPKFLQHYQLNNVPETTLLLKSEDLAVSKKTAYKPKSSEGNIVFGLGAIGILLLMSGIQLSFTVNRVPNIIKNIQTEKSFPRTPNTYSEIVSQSNSNSLEVSDMIVKIAIKNSIYQGKF